VKKLRLWKTLKLRNLAISTLALVGAVPYHLTMSKQPEVHPMSEPSVAEKTRREGLKAKRDVLFAQYLRSPLNTKLAVEIKSIDDDIAKSIEQTQRQRHRK
jgi:hypothetical protein